MPAVEPEEPAMRLFCRRPATSLPAARPTRPPADEPPRGCGWFDSSHELQHGLRVTEHDEFGAVGPLLPLSWWLAWELDAALPSVRREPTFFTRQG